MERLKNVYKVTVTAEKEQIIKYVFSHSHDNATKKIKVFLQRKGIINFNIANVELMHQDVIY